MILQALYDLYQRLPDVDRPGFAPLGVSWAAVLSREGILLALAPLRRPAEKGNRLVPLSLSAPTVGKRTSGDRPGFLADKTDYVFGCNADSDGDPAQKAKAVRRFELFREHHLSARSEIDHPDFETVCRFLESWDPQAPDATSHLAAAADADFAEIAGSNIVFQISGEEGYVHQLPQAIDYWARAIANKSDGATGTCLVTGRTAPLASLHAPAIKGVIGAQSSGASMVSFNLSAFISFGKEQSLNAPVSESAAFAYCTALNHLLADRQRRIRIGDATCVFWTDQPSDAETDIPFLLDSQRTPENPEVRERVRRSLARIAIGKLAPSDLGNAATRFFILGLAPNASRLSVRFWHVGTLGELATNLQKHHDDLRVVRQFEPGPKIRHPDPEVPSVFDLLRQTARDADGIPPLIGGALMRAILLGTNYPVALATAVLGRIRTEREVNFLKAAILKAFLSRNHQQPNPMSLDPEKPDVPYRLGRLFAALEKTQRDALPGINATIRERFYASASATPRAVFGRLLRTHTHHIAKLDGGLKVVREKLVQEILDAVGDFPAHLDLAGQAQFALGYYHQRKAFFTAKETESAA